MGKTEILSVQISETKHAIQLKFSTWSLPKLYLKFRTIIGTPQSGWVLESPYFCSQLVGAVRCDSEVKFFLLSFLTVRNNKFAAVARWVHVQTN